MKIVINRFLIHFYFLLFSLAFCSSLYAIDNFHFVDLKKNHYTSNVTVTKNYITLIPFFSNQRKNNKHHYTFDKWKKK